MAPSIASPRYRVENLGVSTRITITSPKKGVDFIYAGVKAIAWFVGELVFLVILYLSVGGFIAKTLGFDIFLFSASGDGSVDTFLGVLAVVWLAVWTISGLRNTRFFLWQLAGKEILEVSQTGIQWGRRFFGLGKVEEYQAGEISNLRILEDSERTKKNTIAGPNMLAFDYEFGTVEFGGGLTVEEARAVLVAIVKNYRQYAPDG
jgi:hypothetical protein